jgi:predicted phage baseplate assembly protein
MLAGISLSRTALASLRTREDDDFAIALLDGWATVADILTFYQERLANESYLRTATERRSVRELARLIGYEPRPGVAASVNLAFTIDAAAGAAGAEIPAGTRVQSIPAPGEAAQTFETVASIPARAAWNAMRPRLTRPQPLDRWAAGLLCEGLETGLKPGDGLLISPTSRPGGPRRVTFRRVARVTPRPGIAASQTEVALQLPVRGEDSLEFSPDAYPNALSHFGDAPGPSAATQAIVAWARKAVLRHRHASGSSKGVSTADLRTFVEGGDYLGEGIARITVDQLFANLAATEGAAPAVLAFRVRGSLFGHNAPSWESLPEQLRVPKQLFVEQDDDFVPFEETLFERVSADDFDRFLRSVGFYSKRKRTWADGNLDDYLRFLADGNRADAETITRTIFLDTTYAGISRGSIVVLRDGISGKWDLFRVEDAAEVAVADFTLTAKVTRLTLNKAIPGGFSIRSTTVYALSEQLPLARLPETVALEGDVARLNAWVSDLYAGQQVVICGELARDRGNRACETARLKEVRAVLDGGGYSEVEFEAALTHTYVRETVSIAGNVAPATHGETRPEEVLGSGSAAQPYQSFTLRQPPLTYVSASTPSGVAATLTVRVNHVRWREVPNLLTQGPDDRVYVVRGDEQGRTVVQFGDGRTGARLPTGQENVSASYRAGIGLAGLVSPGQLSLLLTRPAAVTGVTNPLPAAGADGPESLADARRNAPMTIVTLDRIVSLRDYEDFARAFSGIAKAQARWVWDGRARAIVVTVAGPGGAEATASQREHLEEAMRRAGETNVPLRVEPFQKRTFQTWATLRLYPDYLPDRVAAAVNAAMHTRFSFAAREFGQPVYKGEVIATMQGAPGVVAVQLRALFEPPPGDEPAPEVPPVEDELTAIPAPNGSAALRVLDPRPVALEWRS